MAKTPVQARLDEVLGKALAPMLKAAGYRKSGRTFRRKHGSCVQVVNVQASTSSSATSLKFTVNLGVFFEEVSAANPGWQPEVGEAGPDVWSCHVRERIGALMPAKQDTWWALGAAEDPQQRATELERVFRDYALPWLAEMSDFKKAQRAADLRGERNIVDAFALAAGEGPST